MKFSYLKLHNKFTFFYSSVAQSLIPSELKQNKQNLLRTFQESLKNLNENKKWANTTHFEQLKHQLDTKPEIWTSDIRLAKQLSRDIKISGERLKELKVLETSLLSIQEMLNLAEEEKDVPLYQSCIDELNILTERTSLLENESLLLGSADHLGCFIEINAGLGGTEAMFWAEELETMYLSWIEKQGYSFVKKERTCGSEAGIRHTMIQVDSPYAYGWFRSEQGVHRVIRLSAFDKEHRRQTAFAQVAIYPYTANDTDDDLIELKESDLSFEAFRSSGPGGQSVNTTSSAVRVIHLPTGISVSCQQERGQHRNKATALVLLKGKLLGLKLKQKRDEEAKQRSLLPEASFGSQIRTYYFHPKQFIKDHRSLLEEHSCDDMMIGGNTLNRFMQKYLQWDSQRENK
jgi:peptide chain release factor 2